MVRQHYNSIPRLVGKDSLESGSKLELIHLLQEAEKEIGLWRVAPQPNSLGW
jgi:hypothetical protein